MKELIIAHLLAFVGLVILAVQCDRGFQLVAMAFLKLALFVNFIYHYVYSDEEK